MCVSYFSLFVVNIDYFSTMTATEMYGYEDANPSKLGHDPTTCDTDKYGYGSAATTSDDANNKYGYDFGPGSTHSSASSSTPYGYGDDDQVEQRPVCRDRARRRCSVTEYSLEAQIKVVKEDEAYQGGDDARPSSGDSSMDLSGESTQGATTVKLSKSS
jgi:hypothetical protein